MTIGLLEETQERMKPAYANPGAGSFDSLYPEAAEAAFKAMAERSK